VLDAYRRKSDGVMARAHQKDSGDWLLQTEPGGSFQSVNDWYFSRTYAEARDDERRT